MSKGPNSRPAKPVALSPAGQSAQPTHTAPAKTAKEQGEPNTKQARVVAMLRSPVGATISAMMKATDWQQHSVRGFLAGVVRKKLKLKLSSKKSDGNRVYRIAASGSSRSKAARPGRHKA
jgi:Protein of unknown function (DUF3489)